MRLRPPALDRPGKFTPTSGPPDLRLAGRESGDACASPELSTDVGPVVLRAGGTIAGSMRRWCSGLDSARWSSRVRRPSGRAPPRSQIYRASAGPPPFSGPYVVPDPDADRRVLETAVERSSRRRRRRPRPGPDRADLPQVRELGLDDRVHLLGQVRLAGLRGPLEDVVDGLGAADHDVAGRVRRRAVARSRPGAGSTRAGSRGCGARRRA